MNRELPPAAAALAELDGHLSALGEGRLSLTRAHRIVDLLAQAPGRTGAVVRALADSRSAAGLDALLRLPPDRPGVIEAAHRGLRAGLCRPWPAPRPPSPRRLALDFPHSRARRFPPTLARAVTGLHRPPRSEVQRLSAAGTLRYRVVIAAPAGPELELEVAALRRGLARLRGVTLWLNGWSFPSPGPFPEGALTLLVGAWFEAEAR